jgi:hypothetical protein
LIYGEVISMRVTLRLSLETLKGIKKLKKLYEEEFDGEFFSQGDVIYRAYKETEGSNWQEIKDDTRRISYPADIFDGEFPQDGKTTVNLNEELKKAITDMQMILPSKFGVSRVTTAYCIKLIIKAALLEK